MANELTVVIPTYNRNDYLIKILNTIPSNQTVVIGDNGGSVTEEIRNQYPSFSFIRPDRKLEMFENWNFCVSQVKTKWFIIPSDDDLFYPNAFSRISEAIANYKDADIIIFGGNTINEFDKIISTWSSSTTKIFEKPNGYQYFKYAVEARLPGVLFKTEMAKTHGLFDERLVYTGADSLLIQKCMLYGNSVVIPHVISAYRVWQNNFTSKFISTPDWLDKIDKWQDEILAHVKSVYKQSNIQINTKQIKDQVYANNLLAGIVNLKAKSRFKDKILFIKSVRFPWKASFLTKLKILKALAT